MRRSLVVALAAGCVLPAVLWAGNHDRCNAPPCGHCIVPPPPACPKCTNPCDECRLYLCPACLAKETPIWIERLLRCANAEARKHAAEKLGCRLCADFCRTPQVLTALIAALHCDPCWEVRRAAATAIRSQNARTPQAILALYIASRLDPHYLVRERANESIDVLLVLQRPCYKRLFKDADELITELGEKYKPGSHDCQKLYSLCGRVLKGKDAPASETAPSSPGVVDEDKLPGPTNLPKEAEGRQP